MVVSYLVVPGALPETKSELKSDFIKIVLISKFIYIEIDIEIATNYEWKFMIMFPRYGLGGHGGPRGGDGVGNLLHPGKRTHGLGGYSPGETDMPAPKKVSFFSSEFVRHKIRCKPKVSTPEVSAPSNRVILKAKRPAPP
ncbi:hypothetical protein TNCV_1966241 [Trichonephila clavipes]|nr:hypothetical protein TNCV_1966241 [Trichonephila clavipes]